MAQCLELVTVSGTPVLSLDPSTPPSSCAMLVINGSEYGQLSHGFVDNAQDATTIVSAFLALYAIVFGLRWIARSLSTADDISDERH